MFTPAELMQGAGIALDVMLATHEAPAALAARQAQRLAALLAAARHSPLYRPLLAGRDPARLALSDLPVSSKPWLMARFDDWCADRQVTRDALRRFMADRRHIGEPFAGRYTVWESSGSRGEPGLFVQDAGAMAVYDALEALRRPPLRPVDRLLDPWYLGERLAFVGAIDGHFASTVSLRRLQRLNPALGPRLHLLSFLLPMPELVAQLNALAPTIMATYPSMAVLLAEQRAAGRLHVSPREVWCGGETLTPGMRAFVQRALDCPVGNSYGLSEFLSLASECRCARLHLNSDWAILESVDAHGQPAAPGVAGTTALLTNLANHLQPLIRCDVGDRVTMSAEACPCGSPLPVIEVLGRCDDTLRLGAPGRPLVAVAPLALCTVLEDDAGLFDFQLVQQRRDRLGLSTTLAGAAGDAALRRAREVLQAFLARQGISGVRIDCRSGGVPRRGRSGKAQRVISLLERQAT